MNATALIATFVIAPPLLAQPRPTTLPSTTQPAKDVEQTLEVLYRLEPGQDAKFIPPPFIEDRIALGYNPALANKGQYVFHWTADGVLKRWSYSAGDGTVASALSAAGLSSWEIDAAEGASRYASMPGDWIIRKDARRDRLLAAVQRIFAQQLPDLTVEKRQVEREVVRVSGTFNPAAHPKLYVMVGDHLSQNGGGSGTIHTFFSSLSNMKRQEIVDESQSPDDHISWGWDLSVSDDGVKLKDLFAQLTWETGLQFKLDRKTQTIYVITQKQR